MKKLIAMLMVVTMMVGLVACSSEPDPNAGKYIAVTATALGIEMPIEDVLEGETWIELKNGGKGDLMLDGQKFGLKWTLEGEDITITIQGEDSYGTLADGAITVDLMDLGCEYRFELEG